MKFEQNYKLPKFSGAYIKIATAGLCQNMSKRNKSTVTKMQPRPVYNLWNFYPTSSFTFRNFYFHIDDHGTEVLCYREIATFDGSNFEGYSL